MQLNGCSDFPPPGNLNLTGYVSCIQDGGPGICVPNFNFFSGTCNALSSQWLNIYLGSNNCPQGYYAAVNTIWTAFHGGLNVAPCPQQTGGLNACYPTTICLTTCNQYYTYLSQTGVNPNNQNICRSPAPNNMAIPQGASPFSFCCNYSAPTATPSVPTRTPTIVGTNTPTKTPTVTPTRPTITPTSTLTWTPNVSTMTPVNTPTRTATYTLIPQGPTSTPIIRQGTVTFYNPFPTPTPTYNPNIVWPTYPPDTAVPTDVPADLDTPILRVTPSAWDTLTPTPVVFNIDTPTISTDTLTPTPIVDDEPTSTLIPIITPTRVPTGTPTPKILIPNTPRKKRETVFLIQ